ncbi:hypothetical protein [Methylobacterium oxalidis]
MSGLQLGCALPSPGKMMKVDDTLLNAAAEQVAEAEERRVEQI